MTDVSNSFFISFMPEILCYHFYILLMKLISVIFSPIPYFLLPQFLKLVCSLLLLFLCSGREQLMEEGPTINSFIHIFSAVCFLLAFYKGHIHFIRFPVYLFHLGFVKWFLRFFQLFVHGSLNFSKKCIHFLFKILYHFHWVGSKYFYSCFSYVEILRFCCGRKLDSSADILLLTVFLH